MPLRGGRENYEGVVRGEEGSVPRSKNNPRRSNLPKGDIAMLLSISSHVMSWTHGRHVGFDPTGKWCHSIHRPRRPKPRTKHEVYRMIRCGHSKFDISRWVHLGPHFGGRGHRSHRSYHSKELRWFPIGSPL